MGWALSLIGLLRGPLFLCLVEILSVRAAYFAEPVLAWANTLAGAGDITSRGLRKDNAVVLSDDGTLLFVTTDDGSLHVLRASDGEELFDPFEPEPVAGTYTECRSGISLSSSGQYAVYAVIDIPITAQVAYDGIVADEVASTTGVKSRVIAVNLDGSLRWSFPLDGYVVGTPAIGWDDNTVYVSHNVVNKDNGIDGLVPYRGTISVMRDNGGIVVRIAEIRLEEEQSGPFGPVMVQALEGSDVVVWSESWGEGYIERGNFYVMDTSGEYKARVLSQWGRPSVTRPVLSRDGRSVWVGTSSTSLAGWVLDSGLDIDEPVQPAWQRQLQQSARNGTQPLLSPPALSTDGGLLFVAGASNVLYCIDSQTGSIVWTEVLGTSVFLSELKVTEPEGEQGVVYSIESLSGRVHQLDILNGRSIWDFDCERITGIYSCQDSVEAEFSVSRDGNFVYYGDIFGKIIALQVADFVTSAPTAAPLAPPTMVPTMIPTSIASPPPTTSPTPVGGEVLAPSPSPTAVLVANTSTTSPTPVGGEVSSPSPSGDVGSPPSAPPTSSVAASSSPSPAPSSAGALGSPPPSTFIISSGSNQEGSNDEKATDILMIAGPAVGGVILCLALVFFIAGRRRRRLNIKRASEMQTQNENDTSRKWREQQLEYERSCEMAEKATLMELSGANLESPTKKSRPAPASAGTPSTLESIEEADETSSSIIGSSPSSPQEPLSPARSFDRPMEPVSPSIEVLPVNLDKMILSSAAYPVESENSQPISALPAPDSPGRSAFSEDTTSAIYLEDGSSFGPASSTTVADPKRELTNSPVFSDEEESVDSSKKIEDDVISVGSSVYLTEDETDNEARATAEPRYPSLLPRRDDSESPPESPSVAAPDNDSDITLRAKNGSPPPSAENEANGGDEPKSFLRDVRRSQDMSQEKRLLEPRKSESNGIHDIPNQPAHAKQAKTDYRNTWDSLAQTIAKAEETLNDFLNPMVKPEKSRQPAVQRSWSPEYPDDESSYASSPPPPPPSSYLPSSYFGKK